MSRVPTVRTKGPTGDLVVINEADYDPAKHQLFDVPEKAEKAPEVTKESEKAEKAEKPTKRSRSKIEE